MRLFIAVNFESQVRDLIERAIEEFPVNRPPWRWTRPETWHVTLKFLGDMPESDVAPLSMCMEQVSSRHREFPLSLTDFGGFPNLRRPRVLFYRVGEGAEALRSVADDVEDVLSNTLGIPREKKAFRAHVTVARVKSALAGPVADRLRNVPPLLGATQTVASIDLMKSELRPAGARYERLKGFALAPTS
jgi:2'-5' RNA ligase